MANQLLALSRADARMGHAQALERIDLKQLCEVLLEAHLDDAMDKGLDLGLEVMPAHANGVEWLLRELVSNLLDNAIRYTPPGGHVTLRCGRRPHPVSGHLAVFVEVEDDGPGVPLAERIRVLERFYRVTGTQGEGNGLGLAIAAEIVATSSLKTSEGFTRLWPSVLTVVAYGVSFYLLSQTLKRMEIGVVYAIWSGAGTALMALVGYLVFQESMSAIKLVSIAMIVLGVVGLNMGDLLTRTAP